MASVTVEGDRLHVRMSPLERLAAFHGDVVVPLSSIAEARVIERALDGLRGIRAPGTGVPGVIAYGTRRGSFGRDFAAVRGSGPGLVIELRGAKFRRVVVSLADPDPARELITASTRR